MITIIEKSDISEANIAVDICDYPYSIIAPVPIKISVYLVWERESYEEYGVILITLHEEKAQELSGEKEAGTYLTSNDGWRWYEKREVDKEYPFDYEG